MNHQLLRYPLPPNQSETLSYPLSDREYKLLYICRVRVGGSWLKVEKKMRVEIVSEFVPQIFHYGHNRKACATKYETHERIGVLAEGLCHDYGSPASLLIQLPEAA